MSERDMFELIRLVNRHLGRQFVESTDWLRGLDATSIAAIERDLVAGNIQAVVKLVEQAALKFAAEAHAGYVQSGRRIAQWLDDQPALKDRLIHFDASGSRVAEFARRNRLELVQSLTEDTRTNIQQVMSTSTERNPRAWARDIREGLGLTANQAEYVRNYRAALERGDWSKALGYELSDGRADRSVAALQRNGGSLSQDRIDAMVETYRRNQLAWRAENIARTEASKNVHAGRRESIRQAVERGDIEAGQLVREWIPGPRTQHSRDTHRASALLAQRPRFDEDFVLADGTRMSGPGDARGGVENVAHCRCTEAARLIA